MFRVSAPVITQTVCLLTGILALSTVAPARAADTVRKPEVVFPPSYDQKVLALEAPGGPPARLSLTIPTITRPGEAFEARLAVFDTAGYPSVACPPLRVLDADGETLLAEISFRSGQPAVAIVKNLRLPGEGFHRLWLHCGGQKSPSNPTRSTDATLENLYWGDPHVHTVLSQCSPQMSRSVDFAYSAGRYATGLDWLAVTDHVSNGRCEFARFKQQALAGDAHNDPPAFVTIPAYEASLQGGAGGDHNVYMVRWPAMFVDEHDKGDLRTLCEKLGQKFKPGEFLVIPHHTTRTGKHGEARDEILPGEAVRPVIEIHSKWGTSEYRGNPNALHLVHDGPSFAQDFLGRGHRLGFVGGTDTHATMPGGTCREPGALDRLPGLTAVRCAALTRREVLDGIRSRRCYAASLERIYLDVRIARQSGGQSVPWTDPKSPRRVEITAAAQSDIRSIEILRNGRVIHARPCGKWLGEVQFVDREDLTDRWLSSAPLGRFAYYYVRLTCSSGAQAWSSPVWLLGK